MTGLLHLAVASPLSYVIALLVPAFDSVIFVLPSETVVIALGVSTAGSTDPRIGVLVALAALGAFLGDNGAYLLGRRYGHVLSKRLFAGEKGARRLAWAQQSLDRFGARIIVGCRFIPGGRTAVTLTCGMVGYPRRSFVPATAVAGTLWASYAFFIGRLGGQAFEDRPWLGLLVAFGTVTVISVLIEVVRRVLRWRGRRRDSGPPPPAGDKPPGGAYLAAAAAPSRPVTGPVRSVHGVVKAPATRHDGS
ncbi:MAG TPA: DedA family protein [Streptosporangiaceae bacterium]